MHKLYSSTKFSERQNTMVMPSTTAGVPEKQAPSGNLITTAASSEQVVRRKSPMRPNKSFEDTFCLLSGSFYHSRKPIGESLDAPADADNRKPAVRRPYWLDLAVRLLLTLKFRS